jgi:hypothetical protein
MAIKKPAFVGGGLYLVLFTINLSTSMQSRYNNHHHNDNDCNCIEKGICPVVQHEGCMFCKYTPAVSKKELWQTIFFSLTLIPSPKEREAGLFQYHQLWQLSISEFFPFSARSPHP